LLIVTGIRSGLILYLNSKTILYKAFNLRLKAINKGNTKIKPGKDTSKANQNVRKISVLFIITLRSLWLIRKDNIIIVKKRNSLINTN
jgi:hypothetical protein